MSRRSRRDGWRCPQLLLAIGAELVAHVASAADAAETGAVTHVFDPRLFRGGAPGESMMARLNRVNAITPAIYKVDLYINHRFVARADIPFEVQRDEGVRACFPRGLLASAGIAMEAMPGRDSDSCIVLEQAVEGIVVNFDQSRLRLDLSVPQHLMRQVPRGHVAASDMDPGETMAFLNYAANAHHVSSGVSRSRDAAYLSLGGGLNFGAWRLRHQSTASHGQGRAMRWNSVRSHVQRSVPAIGSALSIGQNLTPGRLFSGLSYTGLSLSTDVRMLPDSMQGYAPVVRGVARTHARVSILQAGRQIHQVSVAPGAFEIHDLYPTAYNGDLLVVVNEADGLVSRFSVPFSAVPQSLRAGASRYSLDVGRTRRASRAVTFGEAIWERGLSNAVTANAGVRVAGDYQALMLGGAHAGKLGAFGLEAACSRSRLLAGEASNGWKLRVSYSRAHLPANTAWSMAAHVFSRSGYRDLADVANPRPTFFNEGRREPVSIRQRSRFELMVNQPLGRWGSMHASGIAQAYRGTKHDTQLQFGYAHLFPRAISVNLSVARLRTGSSDGGRPGGMDTLTLLSLSFPLGQAGRAAASSLSSSYTQDGTGGGVQELAISGAAGQETNYALGITRGSPSGQTVLGGSLHKRLPAATVGMVASRGSDYWQGALNLQGALAMHAGGITFGPHLDDTFALVEAKGATGARVLNGWGSTIDRHGYALLPSLMPYRYNSVALDPEGMPGGTELDGGEQRIAPDGGAAVKVVFHTRSGQALLIRAWRSDGREIPLGAEVHDDSGGVVGMVGQGGQVYARVGSPQGMLELHWGEGIGERCALSYDLAGHEPGQPLLRLQRACVVH